MGRADGGVFARPEARSLGVLIVVAGMTDPGDMVMARYFQDRERPLVVVANKCDKLRSLERAPAAARIRTALALTQETPLLLYSCTRGEGRQELLEQIESYISML